MDNKQLFPFERNRYYVGKLLTSADFHAEQTYMGNKRRFLNEMLFGPGIVCGLGVYALDDVSLMIESGVALDSSGRELVLDTSVVRKLNTIKGFDELESDRVCLCLQYDEKPVQPVYTVNRRDQEEYEMNRMHEGVSFLLLDEETADAAELPENEFLSRMPLYSGDDYQVELTVPAFIPCGSMVKVTVSVTKLSDRPGPFSMKCCLQSPALAAENGEHESEIVFTSIVLTQGGTDTRELWLTAQNRPAADSLIIAEAGRTEFNIGGEKVILGEKLTVRAVIEPASMEEIIERELNKVSLESRSLVAAPDFIRLAVLSLQRAQNNCIIESVQENGVKKYVRNNADEAQRRILRAYYAEPGGRYISEQKAVPVHEDDGNALTQREPIFATGLCEIPLGGDARAGKIFYSNEIVHGLGKGDVVVSLGFEYLAEDPRTNILSRSTIYGNTELFHEDSVPLPSAELAVKVMNDRGSFLAAAKLKTEATNTLLMLRWSAYKIPAVGDKLKSDLAGRRIASVPPTIVMGTRESHYFNVRFYNMEPCTLTYALTESGSGEITTDGVYTAPAREGVYEIQISCADEPLVCTYAYAVVKKKNEPEGD